VGVKRQAGQLLWWRISNAVLLNRSALVMGFACEKFEWRLTFYLLWRQSWLCKEVDLSQPLASSQLSRSLSDPLPPMSLSRRSFLRRACRYGYLVRSIGIGTAGLKGQSKHQDRGGRDSKWVDADCGRWANSKETPGVILICKGINIPRRCCFE